jgi:pilus assembly protein FimV
VEPPKPEPKPEVVAPKPAPVAEAPKPVEPPAAAPAPQPAPVPAPSKPVAEKPTPPPATAPVEEKGFVDDLIASVMEGGDGLLPIVLGVVVVLAGGIAFVYFNRRRKSIAEFEESILQSEGISGSSGAAVTTDTSGQVVSTGDTSFLSDFSQSGMGNIHTDEVDPIAEAEVYLAYGRDETAEEILKEAVVKNPAREEVKLKLLEIYANRSDVRAFETLAEEMYAGMGGRPSKNWPRVEDMGRKLNPNNPMFKGGAGGAAKAPAGGGFADTAKMKATLPPTSTATLGDTQTGLIPPPASESAGDFDFDMAGASASADQGFELNIGGGAPVKATDTAIDFASEMGGGGSAPGSALDMDLGQPESNVVDFDFGEKEAVSAVHAPETEVAMADAVAGAPAGEAGESPQWDETATKLDLARAYIDMGDSEGARSILDEVMAEGNDQQKKQAKELAAQIG